MCLREDNVFLDQRYNKVFLTVGEMENESESEESETRGDPIFQPS